MFRFDCCVIILSILIVASALYLGFNIFISFREEISINNYIRLITFFIMHLFTQGMMIYILKIMEERIQLIKWLFQVSFGNVVAFLIGQIIVLINSGKIFSVRADVNSKSYSFQVTQLTIYFQIITNLSVFMLIAAIGLIMIKCNQVNQQQRFETIMEHLQSEDYVQQPLTRSQAKTKQSTMCSICLTQLSVERVLKLPCAHVFHKQCLSDWLKKSVVCPLCRCNIQEKLGIPQNQGHQMRIYQQQIYSSE